jgi:medium-chain acyl-[acyl-carrier-protein] hydrolase
MQARMQPTGMTQTNAWFSLPRPNPQARLRLFTFPYAGGTSAIYRAWPQELPASVEVLTAQLPGRVHRLREPPFSHLIPLVEAIAEALTPYLDKPFAFFGHSMGALISFELARHLRRTRQLEPAHLFVSGRSAPQLPPNTPSLHDLPEPEFVKELYALNGTPAEVLEHPELMHLMTPLLRADFSVVGTYEYEPEPPLSCPITAFGGLEDEKIGRERVALWSEQTSAAFTLRMLPGDHFFINTGRTLLLRLLSQDLHRRL